MHTPAFLLGLKDGFVEPYDLSCGITWQHDHGKNESYDQGVNVGQAMGMTFRRLRDTIKVFRNAGKIQPRQYP